MIGYNLAGEAHQDTTGAMRFAMDIIYKHATVIAKALELPNL